MISHTEIISSPITNGYILNRLEIRKKQLGIFYHVWKFLIQLISCEKIEKHYGFYVDGIIDQCRKRNSTKETDWKSPFHYKIAVTIQKRIAEKCWGELLDFHPDDPFYIIGEFEVGDGCEQELLMQIEEDFDFLFENDFNDMFSEETTFQELVDYVIRKTKDT